MNKQHFGLGGWSSLVPASESLNWLATKCWEDYQSGTQLRTGNLTVPFFADRTLVQRLKMVADSTFTSEKKKKNGYGKARLEAECLHTTGDSGLRLQTGAWKEIIIHCLLINDSAFNVKSSRHFNRWDEELLRLKRLAEASTVPNPFSLLRFNRATSFMWRYRRIMEVRPVCSYRGWILIRSTSFDTAHVLLLVHCKVLKKRIPTEAAEIALPT